MARTQPSRSEADPEDTEGRRRSLRHDTDAGVEVVLEPGRITGRADNLSEHGVFLFSSEAVRVRVRIDDGSGVRTLGGRIVRVQAMSEQETGFAIEFDRG